MGDGDVAEEGAGGGGDDCKVGVVAFEGGEEGEGDGVGGVEGQGGWGVEVFDGSLGVNVSIIVLKKAKGEGLAYPSVATGPSGGERFVACCGGSGLYGGHGWEM